MDLAIFPACISGLTKSKSTPSSFFINLSSLNAHLLQIQGPSLQLRPTHDVVCLSPPSLLTSSPFNFSPLVSEFMVPEPAAFLTYAIAQAAHNAEAGLLLEKPVPFTK